MGRRKIHRRIRLACFGCDREDFDGIDEIPKDWVDVDEVQSYEDSIKPVEDRVGEVGLWWTHLGCCPDCAPAMYRNAGELF